MGLLVNAINLPILLLKPLNYPLKSGENLLSQKFGPFPYTSMFLDAFGTWEIKPI